MTDHPPPPLEIDSLARVERFYRHHLESEPEDTAARLGLAWCLFLQSLYRAGQESILEELMAGDGSGEADLPPPAARASPDAGQLLRDCLRETFATLQLSGDPGHITDAEKLQALVRLAGGGETLPEVEARALRILKRLARDVQSNRPSPRRPHQP
jgi:hypothetical protein